MKIDVYYNEFSNWETPIRVRHPECEHPDYEQAIRPDGEPLARAYFCLICGAIGRLEPPDEDGEIFMDWEHEQ